MREGRPKDEMLISDIRHGGKKRVEALEYIFKDQAQRNKIIRFLKSKGCVEQDAEDLYQDAIIIFDRKAASGEFLSMSSIENFIFSIVKLNWYNRYRQYQRTPDADTLFDSKLEEDVSAYYERQERHIMLERILDMFGERCKKLLLLFSQGYSMEDIAEQLGISDRFYARKEKYRCLNRIRMKVQNNEELARYIKNQLSPGDYER